MNVIGWVFTDPPCQRDEPAMNIFGTCMFGGLVDAIGKARNSGAVCGSLASLAEKLDSFSQGGPASFPCAMLFGWRKNREEKPCERACRKQASLGTLIADEERNTFDQHRQGGRRG